MENKDFIQELSERTSGQPKETARNVKQLIDVLAAQLLEENALFVQGFGSFRSEKKDESVEEDVENGRRILYPPHIEVKFVPSPLLLKEGREKGGENEN